ncbi:Rossmann-fold NAD(P)(+)-binding protein [Bisporella sp. PMI_857]|nr:Rossmann-fold NAD(P)(+)-binding protein [Bisporella sp. PMI_857]
MPTTLIFGGSGKVARHLTRILTTETSPAHEVHSIIRNPDQISELETLSAKPIVQSIEEASVSDLVLTLQNTKPNVVVWTAGASGDKNDNGTRIAAVDHHGAVKVMDACAEAGVKRYITISAMDVRDYLKSAPDWYNEKTRERATKVWNAIRPFMEAKFAADKDLVIRNDKRKLEYTIVRAASLGNNPGVETVSAGKVQLAKVVKRENLARVIVQYIKEPSTIKLVFDVAAEDVPVPKEILKVIKERINVFDGYY